MREITRIHIAKVAYDIEIDAKKELEAYIKNLEHYANDAEILDDIEIRITELLTEQGVTTGGVVTKKDLDAVRAQLGEPSDFAPEGAEAQKEKETIEPRRVYRDEEGAVLGGVLAGFGKFFNIDPLWARLVFVVLLFASFGTAIIVYLILWVIIPPAQTVSDKLRMSGQSVTLASIKELAGNEEQRSKKAQTVRKVLGGLVGSLLVLMAIGGLLAIIVAVFGAHIGFGVGGFAPVSQGWVYESWWFMAMMGLFVVSGLLFSALCFLLASAAFRRQWTKRIGVAVVAIVTAGLVTFASGVGIGMYSYASEQARVQEMRETVTGDVPANFKNIKTLVFAEGVNISGPIHYEVSNRSYYELDSLPGVEPEFTVSDDGLTATVRLVRIDPNWSAWDANGVQTWRPWDVFSTPTLTIYGPALDGVEVIKNVSDVGYGNDGGQQSLRVAMRDYAQFNLDGKYEKVTVAGGAYTVASLDDAVINELHVEGGKVMAGVVRTLRVTQPDVCGGLNMGDPHQHVRVRAVSGGRLIYNGEEKPAENISTGCGKVVIGQEYYVEDWEW